MESMLLLEEKQITVGDIREIKSPISGVINKIKVIKILSVRLTAQKQIKAEIVYKNLEVKIDE